MVSCVYNKSTEFSLYIRYNLLKTHPTGILSLRIYIQPLQNRVLHKDLWDNDKLIIRNIIYKMRVNKM